ncbi:hypothetical protein FNL37_2247 [Methylovorus glucosotrophus]|uniref:hypothetical protein n=1 Tax=Methylovorus glucosotrophus TaxID=266009 RepID=UPI0013315A69|nr:hypothetical protein [Methylovorus glucosotrophus]KAF0835949.1 hypothetical protein FNL37_2247 [Methylovorus glucosotrophus]
MKLTRQDWSRLAYPLAGLALALIAAALLISFAYDRVTEAEQALQAQQQQLQQARSRYMASGQEKDTIVSFLPPYKALVEEGFIGEERRILWLDSIRNIHQQYKLFKITYAIGAQEPYTPPFPVDTGSFKLNRSVMQLELPMLHEGDILTFLQALRQQQRSPIIIRECELTRLRAIMDATMTPNLIAKCELDWYTLREAQSGVAP